mmetsp:Transcript_6442/g.15644  ORF Transcript_6442/g.15644 Transcript_6442/m.15644 type:complete len:216 (-) Transcript_6442:184-831(-)
MWKSGMVLQQRSSSFSCTVEAMHCAPQHMFAWVNGTILGFFVVPDVCNTRAKSSRFKDGIGFPIFSPSSFLQAACFPKAKSPAYSSDGLSSISFSTLAFLATLRAFPVFVWSSSLRESLLCNTKHFAGKSMNSNSNSSRLRPMFNGANVHLSANEKNATAASGPFGIAVQRRSSRPSPGTSTTSLTMNSFSILKVSGFLPSQLCRNGRSASGVMS